MLSLFLNTLINTCQWRSKVISFRVACSVMWSELM